MARPGPRKTNRYGDRFKATAVKLSSLPGVLIQDVASALDIHPFMLSLWRKQVRDGVIVAKVNVRCLDGIDLTSLGCAITRFDGQNWEASTGAEH